MKEPISIKELLAVILKRANKIIAWSLILAVLVGGVMGIGQFITIYGSKDSSLEIVEEYESAQKNYERQYEKLSKEISDSAQKLQSQQEYVDNSVLMQIDPYSKWESNTVLAVSNISEDAFKQIYEEEGTPVDYIVSKIQSQYLIYWDNLLLADALENTRFADIEEKYIRELVTLEASDGGTLTVRAIGTTEEDAQWLCDAATNCVMDMARTIESTTYAHELIEVISSTKVSIDQNLGTSQEKHLSSLIEYSANYDNAVKNLENLKKPEQKGWKNILVTAVKWSVLSAVIGCMFGCILVLLQYILRDGVETSRQAEEILKVPYLGSTRVRENIFVRMADRYVGERIWSDQTQAESFIVESIKNIVNPQEQVLVVSTLKYTEDTASVNNLLCGLKNVGYKVSYINNAEENPQLHVALRTCKYVVLAEKTGVSSRYSMVASMQTIKRMNADVIGFVLV